MTTKQIKQLIEIDNAGSGIRAEVQELITRLTSGGVGVQSDDPREAQAKVLWNKGLGRELGLDSFEAYLATIPEIPEGMLAEDERFPELVLVDARFGIVKMCELLGVDYSGNDWTFNDFDPNKARTEKVYWIRCQDGRKNNCKSAAICRQKFADAGDEVGLTVHEGLALFAQNQQWLKNRAIDLPGSESRENYNSSAHLGWFGGRPELLWRWSGCENPDCGSGSRRV